MTSWWMLLLSSLLLTTTCPKTAAAAPTSSSLSSSTSALRRPSSSSAFSSTQNNSRRRSQQQQQEQKQLDFQVLGYQQIDNHQDHHRHNQILRRLQETNANIDFNTPIDDCRIDSFTSIAVVSVAGGVNATRITPTQLRTFEYAFQNTFNDLNLIDGDSDMVPNGEPIASCDPYLRQVTTVSASFGNNVTYSGIVKVLSEEDR